MGSCRHPLECPPGAHLPSCLPISLGTPEGFVFVAAVPGTWQPGVGINRGANGGLGARAGTQEPLFC